MSRARLLTAITVLVSSLGAAGVSAADRASNDGGAGACRRLDLELSCVLTPARGLQPGKRFRLTTTVRNTGDISLADVSMAIRPLDGVRQADEEQLAVTIEKLEPGEFHVVDRWFISDAADKRRITASAREERGWAAAGCLCSFPVGADPMGQGTR